MITNFAAIMVTYKADMPVIERIKHLRTVFDTVIVVDNGSDVLFLAELNKIDGCEVILNGSNLGVGKALNLGVEAAKKRNCDWIACFDQDSNLMDRYRKCLEDLVTTYEKTASIIGCNYFLEGRKVTRHRFSVESADSWVEVDDVITSGTAYRSDIFDEIGVFREDYFIDAVDKEYSWRAKEYGLNILLIREPLMSHSIGTPLTKRIFRRTITSQNHSPIRKYYIARNNIYLVREYWRRRPKDCLNQIHYLVKMAMLIFLVDDDKFAKTKKFCLGIFHGLTRSIRNKSEKSRS